MRLHDLTSHAQAGRLEALHLISLEGGIYLLEARVDGLMQPVEDERGAPLQPRSLEHARELLHGLPFSLVQDGVQDEMCGAGRLH
ncbi:DUF6482 family protein [Pseudomonas sp. CAU 1711]|uniref:DUF6482 family protein n=1 Tax=Pseudomonas sp. CAU 1711 TaxID=3140356 RepID=UPI0032606BEA